MTANTGIPDAFSPPAPTTDMEPDARLRTLSTMTRRRTTWTPSLILRRILERERAGLSLESTVVQRDAINLANAARRHFGAWDDAVALARRTAQRRMPTHTRESIIAKLRAHAAAGLPVSSSHPMLRDCGQPARRLFGSWPEAVVAAGLEPVRRARAKHTRESLIEWMRKRAARGQVLTTYDPEVHRIYHAIRRLFGSWHTALAAAGLPPSTRGNRIKPDVAEEGRP